MIVPNLVIFEEEALEYELGKKILSQFTERNVEIKYSKSGRITGIPGETPNEKFFNSKNTLVVGVRSSMKFESCKPSAHYQLPLVSGCIGMCEYCYLNTQLGKRPYVKINVNVEQILKKAGEYAEERKPDITIFEGAATSDPIPVEPYSGSLAKAIEYFAAFEHTRFRFVTKYTDVDTLLNLNHNNHTTIRFSINSDSVIKKFEHRTPNFSERIKAAVKINESGYPLGFIIAPVFVYDGYKKDYLELLTAVSERFENTELQFEVISHRFTKRAKENILSIYPKSILPMEEELRKFKFGQFGYGKYVYKDEELSEMKEFFKENITKYFGEHSINYII